MDEKPLVKGHLQANGKDYYFCNSTWLSFLIQINEMMSEYEIQFPLGEDAEVEMVTKKVKDTDKFS